MIVNGSLPASRRRTDPQNKGHHKLSGCRPKLIQDLIGCEGVHGFAQLHQQKVVERSKVTTACGRFEICERPTWDQVHNIARHGPTQIRPAQAASANQLDKFFSPHPWR